MTRNETIKQVTSFLKSLPKNSSLRVEARAGIVTQEGQQGFVEKRGNGTMTITILVNGGATDYELSPEWMRANYLASR